MRFLLVLCLTVLLGCRVEPNGGTTVPDVPPDKTPVVSTTIPGISEQSVPELAAYYGSLADLVADSEIIKNTNDIRQANDIAGRLMFKSKVGAPGTLKLVEDFMSSKIGRQVVALGETSDKKRLDAVQMLRELSEAFK